MKTTSNSKSYSLYWAICLAGCLFLACQSDPKETINEDEDANTANLMPLQEEYDESNVKWGFIDKSGKIVIDVGYDEVNNFSEGLAAFRDKASWGYINKNGKVVHEAQYYNAFQFKNQLAKVCNFERKYGFIDQKGEVKIPLIYEDAKNFHEGLCAVKDSTKWGFVNMENQMVIGNSFDAVKDFTDGVAVVKKEGKTFLINKQGKKVSDDFDKILSISKSIFKVKKGKKYGLINGAGKVLIAPTYQSISQMEGDVMAVKKEGEYFLRSLKKDKIEVPQNTDLQYLGSNRWAYAQNEKYGMIDNEGKIIMQPKYSIITSFNDGYGTYQDGQLWGYLDTEGNKLTEAVFGLAWRFNEGLARCISREGVGFLKPDGRLAFVARNFDVRDFHEGLARMPIK